MGVSSQNPQGGSGGSSSVEGNGLVVNVEGAQAATEISSAWPIRTIDGNAVNGNPFFTFEGHWIGKARNIPLRGLGDKPIEMYARHYCIDAIHIVGKTGIITNAVANIYTKQLTGGDLLVDLPAGRLAKLTSKIDVLTFNLNPTLRSADYLQFNVSVQNATEAYVNVFVFGKVYVGQDNLEIPL